MLSEEARQQAQAEGLTLLVAENKAGYFGVYLNQRAKTKPYEAQVWRSGQKVSLGTFATAEEAALCVARSPEGQEAAGRDGHAACVYLWLSKSDCDLVVHAWMQDGTKTDSLVECRTHFSLILPRRIRDFIGFCCTLETVAGEILFFGTWKVDVFHDHVSRLVPEDRGTVKKVYAPYYGRSRLLG